MTEYQMYGLASDDDRGRKAAVGDIRQAYEEIRKLRELVGPASVQAIQIHSAPARLRASSSAQSFAQSLAEISAWDWKEVRLTVEHCDALREGVTPQKGFLSLAEEIEAAREAGRRAGRHIGHTINWARSAIELRDDEAPAAHLARLRIRRALIGLMFSGVSPVATDYGDAWADTHLPGDTGGQPKSFLSAQQIQNCLDAASTASYIGVKVAADPRSCSSQEQRLAPALATVSQVIQARQPASSGKRNS